MIEVRNLTKIYHTEEEGSIALNNISITFPEKGFVAITGESGSGKTTLLNILSGFLPYEEGDLFIDGVDFLTFSDEDLNDYHLKKVGFVFQDYHLLESHTVLDNLIETLQIIGVPTKEAEKKSLEYLKMFELEDLKYNKVRNLSSGQKQRVSIARAMIKDPDVLLCDEPTANLDEETGFKVLKILKEYSKNHLLILSTHNYEDAQTYVTHFVRIYKGNLTSFEEVKHEEYEQEASQEKKPTSALSLSLFSFKNHKFKTIVKTLISSIFTMMFVFLTVLFAANIDEYSTRIISKNTFNNVEKDEVLVMRKDGNKMSSDELNNINSIAHVRGSELYGLASEMNYYYREDIDFINQKQISKETVSVPGGMPEIVEHVDYIFTPVNDSLHIKSYLGMVKESDLSSGSLPTGYYDVVANASYNVGDNIPVYFYDPIMQGYYFIKLDFKVTGILKNDDENLYFSDKFLKGIDYIQYYSNDPILRFGINYSVYDSHGGISATRVDSFYLTPLYNPNLAPNEIQFSTTFIKKFEESLPRNRFSYNLFFANLRGNTTDDRYYIDVNEEMSTSEIDAKFIYVGEDVLHYFLDDYESNTGRVVIDNYAYIDNVIYDLTNQKYDCLSAYRASSTKSDLNKQVRRALSLILSLVIIVIGSFISMFINLIIERSELNDDKTLYLLGANVKSLRKKAFYKIALSLLASIIIGFGLYLIILLLPISFIAEMNLYLRFYHFLIILVVSVLIGLITWWRYHHSLIKVLKKGVEN